MPSLANRPFLPLLFPIGMIFHHPGGELLVRNETGSLVTNFMVWKVLIFLHLADTLILGSLVAILFLVKNFLMWVGWMDMHLKLHFLKMDYYLHPLFITQGDHFL